MAKEHGLTEHGGKTIPKEVKSLADRIRKKENVSDEYAYRTAWDIFRSNTSEGKSYPHKSAVSGLAREGGGTGPIGHEKKAIIGAILEGKGLIPPGVGAVTDAALFGLPAGKALMHASDKAVHIGKKLVEGAKKLMAKKPHEHLVAGFAKRAAELTTEAREALPKSEFAEPKKEAYPIPDLEHGRNALARVSQFGSPAEREAVRKKVYAKYPELKEHYKEQHGGESPISSKKKLG